MNSYNHIISYDAIQDIIKHWGATKNKCGDKWNTMKDGGYNLNTKNHYKYKVIYGRIPVHEELIWCAENCERRFYRDHTPPKHLKKYSDLDVMRFEKEIDAMAFKLRWL